MSETPQKRALKNYRNRLNERGMARFEVLGLDADRELIRSLAKRADSGDSKPDHLRRATNKGRYSCRAAPFASRRRRSRCHPLDHARPQG
jgi:hypothetical protein